MRLICYPTAGKAPSLRPAPSTRRWMDETPQGFAYRCLPLTIANSHGWEILQPVSVRIVWTGAPGVEALQVTGEGNPGFWPVSHFGQGILTFQIHALFRTDPGINLWVGGPVNRPKDGIQPLTGLVESDWSPYSFTMNWQFTRPGEIRFEAGEPFCHFFPVARGGIEAVEPEIRPLESDPELAAQYRAWAAGRTTFNAGLKSLPPAQAAGLWQKSYYRGRGPSGEDGAADHRIKTRPKPFRTDG